MLSTTKYFSRLAQEKILMTTATTSETDYHDHDFLELAYVVQGRANHQIGGRSSVIGQGDYFIVDYGVRHKYTRIGQTPFVVINCLFLPRLIDETLSDCRNFQDLADNYLIKFSYRNLCDCPTNLIYHDHDGHIGKLFTRLSKEYNEKQAGYHEIMRCLLIEILIDAMRQIPRTTEVPENSELVQYIADQININFMEKLSLSTLAQDCCYSLAYVSKRFKEETGMTFRDYLHTVRIRESCRLLANTTKKISEICKLVGYTDIKFFNRIFKNQMGMTPREFKRLEGRGNLSGKEQKS